MKKVYYLKTCNTCQRIIKELELPDGFELREIKSNPISEEELKILKTLAGSYEALFSRRAQLYKQRNLKEKNLSEEDIKNLILEHYTFIKRPILLLEDLIFVGNNTSTVASAKEAISAL